MVNVGKFKNSITVRDVAASRATHDDLIFMKIRIMLTRRVSKKRLDTARSLSIFLRRLVTPVCPTLEIGVLRYGL